MMTAVQRNPSESVKELVCYLCSIEAAHVGTGLGLGLHLHRDFQQAGDL